MVSVLWIMLLLTVEGWAVWSLAGQALKSSRQWQDSVMLFWQAERVLDQVEKMLLSGPVRCEVPSQSLRDIHKQLKNALPNVTACSGMAGFSRYAYRVEFLGRDACVRLSETGDTAGYFRITLLVTSRLQESHILLQTIILKAEPVHLPCQGTVRMMSSGRLSWREAEI